MQLTLDQLVTHIKNTEDTVKRNQLIRDYRPFILQTIVVLKNAYITSENDEEFSVGLEAFNEAIDRFDDSKGAFLPFAKLVIESRLKNFWEKEAKMRHELMDPQSDAFKNVPDTTSMENTIILRQEIYKLEKALELFGLDFNKLVKLTPKHADTRTNIIGIGLSAAKFKEIVSVLYEKRKLPIKLVSQKTNASLKVVKTHKYYLTTVIIASNEKLSAIIEWLSEKN